MPHAKFYEQHGFQMNYIVFVVWAAQDIIEKNNLSISEQLLRLFFHEQKRLVIKYLSSPLKTCMISVS